MFALGTILLLLIDSITGYPISRTQGRFYIALVGGLAYTGYLYRSQPAAGTRSREAFG
ncbi:MAG: hypothetical protein ACLFRH_09470 [Halothiobacillaceae bacterium]